MDPYKTLNKTIKSLGLFTVKEKEALSEIVKRAKKWDKHLQDTKPDYRNIYNLVEYYYDKTLTPLDARDEFKGFNMRYAKLLLKEYKDDYELVKKMVDRASIKWGNYVWSLKGCYNNREILRKEIV